MLMKKALLIFKILDDNIYMSSLIESAYTVNEDSLNISNNPKMVDHIYSRHGPEEEDGLQIVTEDHAYEESAGNIQDIR